MVLRNREVDDDDQEEDDAEVLIRFEGDSSWHELPGGVVVYDDGGALKVELTDEHVGFIVRKYADARGGRVAAGAVEGLGRVAADYITNFIRDKGQRR